jgi:hypothetical protein
MDRSNKKAVKYGWSDRLRQAGKQFFPGAFLIPKNDPKKNLAPTKKIQT